MIRDRLGYEDIKTTLGTYGHLYPNTNIEVATKLNNLIEVNYVSTDRQLISNQFITCHNKI